MTPFEKMDLVARHLGVTHQALADALAKVPGRRISSPHGTPDGYLIHNCRCAECVEAKRRRNRAKIRRTQQATLAAATRKGYQWTGPELEMLARDDLTARQLADMLGRTYHAVSNQRRKLRAGEPRQTYLAGKARA